MKLKYDSWDKISINIFQQLRQRVDEVEITGDKDIDAINQNVVLLSVLCDVDEDTIATLDLSEVGKLLKATDFLKEIPKVDIKDNYIVNGKEYEVFRDIQNMTMAQYIDFQTLYKDGVEKHAKELVACFLLPKGKKYGEYNIVEVVNEIGEYLPIADAHSIMFFFVIAFRSLTKVMLTSLTKKMKKMMKQEKDREQANKMKMAINQIEKSMSLLQNGDGLTM